MALKPYRECKKKVSTEAQSCPNSGVPNPTIKKNTKLKYIYARRGKIFFCSVIFIFFFQSLVIGNEIKRIKIEGMSIGDSALNFFSESEIKKVIITDWTNRKYERSEIKSNQFNKFDIVQFSYLSEDKDFKIAEIQGLIKFEYSKCLDEINKIAKKLENKLTSAQIQPPYERGNKWDTFGKSKTTDIIIALNDGNQIGVLDTITLYCYQYSDGYKKKWNLSNDDLGFKVSSKEFEKFIFIEAYK